MLCIVMVIRSIMSVYLATCQHCWWVS